MADGPAVVAQSRGQRHQMPDAWGAIAPSSPSIRDGHHTRASRFEPKLVLPGASFEEDLPAANPLLRYDPVDHLRHMGQTLWEQRVFTDVSIVCDNQELTRVHRCVLAAASPVFAAMLQGEMKEARERRIVFRDTEPSAVEAMLQFVYTGALPKGVDPRAVLRLATMYGIQGLAAHCCHSLVSTLTTENVVESVRVLRACIDNEVAQRAYRMLCDKIFSEREFFDIVVQTV